MQKDFIFFFIQNHLELFLLYPLNWSYLLINVYCSYLYANMQILWECHELDNCKKGFIASFLKQQYHVIKVL